MSEQWTSTGATYDAEDGAALAAVLDGVVDDAVLLGRFLPLRVLHVGKTLLCAKDR